jgi:hypothetical protein
VRNADHSRQRVTVQALLEIEEFTLGATTSHLAVMYRRNARRVIAAVLEPLQRIHETPRNRAAANDSNNTAHKHPQSLLFRGHS